MSDCTKRCIGDHFYCSDRRPSLSIQKSEPQLTLSDICELDMCRHPRTLYLERDKITLTRYCPIRTSPASPYATQMGIRTDNFQMNAGK